MENNIKQHINLVVLGYLASGKSTLSGHLLSHLASNKDKELIKAQIQQNEKTNPKTKYAWLMNHLKAQRDKGQTIQTTAKRLQTDKYSFNIIDVPGRKDYIKNLLVGASQADCSMLVIDAVEQRFKNGFIENGQTRQHAILAYGFGVKQMIVVINKMDEVEYKQERFTFLKKEVGQFLKKVGFQPANITFIPISSYEGDNLFSFSQKMEWYKQLTVLQSMNQLLPPKKIQNKPLRIPIQRIYNIEGVGTVPIGKVQFGTLKKGMKVIVSPGGFEGEIKSLQTSKEQIQQGNIGYNVGIGFTNQNLNLNIKKGYVIGQVNKDPPKLVESFLAQVVILNHPQAIKKGYTPMIQCHTSYIPCKIYTILSKIDRKTGKILQNNPQNMKIGDFSMIVFKPSQPFSCQPFTQYPSLGRFVARDNNVIVAVGVIKKCEKKDINI